MFFFKTVSDVSWVFWADQCGTKCHNRSKKFFSPSSWGVLGDAVSPLISPWKNKNEHVWNFKSMPSMLHVSDHFPSLFSLQRPHTCEKSFEAIKTTCRNIQPGAKLNRSQFMPLHSLLIKSLERENSRPHRKFLVLVFSNW